MARRRNGRYGTLFAEQPKTNCFIRPVHRFIVALGMCRYDRLYRVGDRQSSASGASAMGKVGSERVREVDVHLCIAG